MFDLIRHNQTAWDAEARRDSPWSRPVEADVVSRARAGEWVVHLTPSPLPADWLGEVKGRDILCLAGAGGQQAPVLAAAGANVTVFDLSSEQLRRDADVAQRDGLALRLEQGDMRNLARFGDEVFDLIVHPISNQYVPNIAPVWAECHRVLRPGGILLSSFYNPVVFVADRVPRVPVPWSDLASFGQTQPNAGRPLLFGHSLLDQIGGQISAGFVLTGYFEEMHPAPRFDIERYVPAFIATRSART